MTLTDNVQRVANLANDVMRFADRSEYEEAHSALDDISIKVLKLHRHIDNLQRKADCAARPPGDNSG